MRVILPGERVVVTNRLLPRDRESPFVQYGAFGNELTVGVPNSWGQALAYLLGWTYIDVCSCGGQLDYHLWKGGWPSE